MKRPIGYFVHHQGRGHALRCAAWMNALSPDQPVTVFCARDDIFPSLRETTTVRRIPSLFEARGDEPAGLADYPTPETLHCAPLGWSGIREAMSTIAGWFAEASPAVMICDVSAEIAQLSRICSVPHVKVLQHGDRADPGHMAAYDGAVGLLAPFHASLAQPEWPARLRSRMHFAPGLGVDLEPPPSREAARRSLGLPSDQEVIFVLSGGGGSGFSQAPICVGARATPQARWIAAGHVSPDWHSTAPGNLAFVGWIDTVALHIAAADVVVASTGNTTCHGILATGRPWLAVPEWRYFDEQVFKARALETAGAAVHLAALPSSAHAWLDALARARATHSAERQQALVGGSSADAAAWLADLADRIWRTPDERRAQTSAAQPRLAAS